MRKIALCIFLLLLFASMVGAADFRNASWGMTKEEVISSESIKLTEVEYPVKLYFALCGDSKIAEQKIMVIYVFDDEGKLSKGEYVFTEEEINPDSYYVRYQKINSLLLEKYDKPAVKEEQFKEFRKNFKGLALLEGSGYCFTRWDFDDGNGILHGISGRNRKLRHFITYTTYEARKKEENFLRDAAKSKL